MTDPQAPLRRRGLMTVADYVERQRADFETAAREMGDDLDLRPDPGRPARYASDVTQNCFAGWVARGAWDEMNRKTPRRAA